MREATDLARWQVGALLDFVFSLKHLIGLKQAECRSKAGLFASLCFLPAVPVSEKQLWCMEILNRTVCILQQAGPCFGICFRHI